MSQVYTVSVLPLRERKIRIGEVTTEPHEHQTVPYFRSGRMTLPVVPLPLELPIYRMQNYRTRTAQMSYIRERGLSATFFSEGQENQEAQQAQHTLLYRMAQQGQGESVVPIVRVLQREEQQEPILITASGIVVNGNRRLAAMRELFQSGEGDFDRFRYVQCLVLPLDATETEIVEIEVRLQMQLETKLPYSWIDECLATKELVEASNNREYVARLMNKDTKAIDASIQALNEVDIYLSERIGDPSAYDLVRDSQQAFTELVKALKGKSGDDLEASRLLAHALIDRSEALGTRLYDYRAVFGDKSREVIKRIRPVFASSMDEAVTLENHGLDIDIDLDEHQESDDTSVVINILNKRDEVDKHVEVIRSVFDDIREDDAQKRTGENALRMIREANTKLMTVSFAQASTTTYMAIREQLSAILQRASELEREIVELSNES